MAQNDAQDPHLSERHVPTAHAGSAPLINADVRASIKELEGMLAGTEAPGHRRVLRDLRNRLDDGRITPTEAHAEYERILEVAHTKT